jgi:hypothetical protein
MDGTIIQQGKFISDAEDQVIQLRSDVDWMRVYNLTNAAGAVANDGVEFYWQRGMAANNGLVYFHAAGTQVISITTALAGVPAGTAVPGFTLVDSSAQSTGPALAFTAISAGAHPPVVTAGAPAVATLRTGDVVRLSNVVGAPQFSGLDFSIIVLSPTTFSLAGAPQLAVAGTTGFFRKINFDPAFYPSHRVIAGIAANGALAAVDLMVNHDYVVGQQIRFNIPPVNGMPEINNMVGTIVRIIAPFAIEVDIDVSTFTPYVFPIPGDVPFTPGQVTPIGENTATALIQGVDILSDATRNELYIGMILGAGVASPGGGVIGNDMYWVAGKSFSNLIEV